MWPGNTFKVGVFVLLLACTGCGDRGPDSTLSTDGVRIVFETTGEGSPALVFVHGWSNDKSLWDDQKDRFSRDHQVVVLDLPGFGESGGNRESWTIEQFGSDVASVVRDLAIESAILVGFSMGGPVAVEAAIQLSDETVGLVLVDTVKHPKTPLPPEMRERKEAYLVDIVTNPDIEKLRPFLRGENLEEAHQRVLKMVEGGLRESWVPSLRATFDWYDDRCVNALAQIQVPVIAINSEIEPTDVDALRSLLPSIEVKILPDAAHALMLDAPEDFNRLLEESVDELAHRTDK